MVLDKGITTKSTPVGGTNLGDAIRQATKQIFNSSAGKHMDLIIITDGEENEDNFPLEAAAAANEKGIRIIAIGLGDKENGARIPIYNGSKKTFVTYQGREVWTKLNTDILTKIAAATTDGQCLTVQPGYTFDLDEIYKDLIFSAQKKQLESASSIRYQQKFQIFAAIALIILIGEIFVSQRKRQQNEN
jgi:Ca-activated chloride channel family protein